MSKEATLAFKRANNKISFYIREMMGDNVLFSFMDSGHESKQNNSPVDIKLSQTEFNQLSDMLCRFKR